MAQYGSLINQIAATGVDPDVIVGDGATVLYWSDRQAATIVQVDRFKSGQRKGEVSGVWVTYDKATRVDRNGMSDDQSYEYETQSDGERVLFKRRKDGRYRNAGGAVLRIGTRDHYYDFSR